MFIPGPPQGGPPQMFMGGPGMGPGMGQGGPGMGPGGPGMGQGGPGMGGGMPPGPPQFSGGGDEPPMKRMRTEESLIPEGQFIRQHPGRVNVLVSVPNVDDKPEWKLNGQVLQLSFPITE